MASPIHLRVRRHDHDGSAFVMILNHHHNRQDRDRNPCEAGRPRPGPHVCVIRGLSENRGLTASHDPNARHLLLPALLASANGIGMVYHATYVRKVCVRTLTKVSRKLSLVTLIALIHRGATHRMDGVRPQTQRDREKSLRVDKVLGLLLVHQ